MILILLTLHCPENELRPKKAICGRTDRHGKRSQLQTCEIVHLYTALYSLVVVNSKSHGFLGLTAYTYSRYFCVPRGHTGSHTESRSQTVSRAPSSLFPLIRRRRVSRRVGRVGARRRAQSKRAARTCGARGARGTAGRRDDQVGLDAPILVYNCIK